MKRKVVAGCVLALAMLGGVRKAAASAYNGKPKLVVILVLDQFRGDYLDRFRADFKTQDGFNLFLRKGAYFPNAYYDYANLETAPGHSTIGTCAYSDGHNIGVNDWWDLSRSRTHMVSSVEDEAYPLVGASSNAQLGASPRNELASTLGDEVVLGTGGKAKLFGVSLKDRAAILTSGHASTGAYWIDQPTGHWETSTYWRKDLPEWVKAFNAHETEAARKKAGVSDSANFYGTVGATPEGVAYELAFTKALIENEKLGQDAVTDVLTLSISSTDILGHQVGPDDPRQRAMIDSIDGQLNEFFTWLGVHVQGGLPNVWVALTGDHGVAPNVVLAAKEGMPAGHFSYMGWVAELNRELGERFPAEAGQRFVLGGEMPYLQMDPGVFEKAGVKNEAEAEKMVAALAPKAMDTVEASVLAAAPDSRALRPVMVRRVFTKSQIAKGDVPATDDGRMILHSFTTNGGWWVRVELGMYQMAGTGLTGTTHFSANSYDRHVPVAFYGSAFVPGTYLQQVSPVDISATFAALLRVNRPSACVGHVVTMALRPAGLSAAQDGKAVLLRSR